MPRDAIDIYFSKPIDHDFSALPCVVSNISFSLLSDHDSVDRGSLIVLTPNVIDESSEYCCIMFKKSNFPAKIVFGGSNSLLDFITMGVETRSGSLFDVMAINQSYEFEKSLKEIEPSISVVPCVSYQCDFCVLLPAGYSYKAESIVERYIRRWQNEGYDQMERQGDYTRLCDLKRSVIQRLHSQNIYRSNPNFDKQYDIITDLLSIPCEHIEESEEYALLAVLNLHSMLMEARWRWTNSFGELHYESAEYTKERERICSDKIEDIRRFISQSSGAIVNRDQIWSLLYISRVLLASIMKRDKKTADRSYDSAPENLKNRDNFYGFLPQVTSEVQEITSYYRDHLSPDYNYGFLAIPEKYTGTVWRFFPAYVHEFYHYIAPSNRMERNKTVVKLAIHGVLNPLYRALTQHILNGDKIYKGMHMSICDHIFEICDVTESADENGNNVDSMYLLFKMSSYENIDFKKLYDYAEWSISINNLVPEIVTLINDCSDDCVKLWNDDFFSYLRTVTIALREIRSDISMCHFLWGDRLYDNDMYVLKRYIAILAAEHGFARAPVYFTADSTILRFGFMTRYLYFKSIGQKRINGFNDRWFRTVINYIEEGLKTKSCEFVEYKDYGEISVEKLNHLRDYIIEYKRISIQERNMSSSRGASVFEDLLYPEMGIAIESSDKSVNSLAGRWEEDLKKMTEHRFAKEMRSIYRTYERMSIDSNVKGILELEYRSRLVFRNLCYYFPNIDL